MFINIPNNVQFIIDTFYNNNYEAFMVGGCVRDCLLGLTPKDYDITTSALPNITESLFEKTIPTGIKHGTVTVVLDNENLEVTTYRTEGNYLDNRHPESVEFVSNIKEDAQWLLNMVENLLTVTRIQNDSPDKVKKTLEVVEEVVSEAILRLQKRHPGVKIKVHMPNNFLMLPMDPTLIEQVLINLMENAFVHSGSSEPVELAIHEEADSVIFRVRDYGKGISEQQMPGLFEGQQPAGTATDGYKGIGIGLTICKTIIQAHGGAITAANHKNGADFTFTLPKEKEDSDNA